MHSEHFVLAPDGGYKFVLYKCFHGNIFLDNVNTSCYTYEIHLHTM